jgi:hypothetical protein
MVFGDILILRKKEHIKGSMEHSFKIAEKHAITGVYTEFRISGTLFSLN